MDLELLALIVGAVAYWRTTLALILFGCVAIVLAESVHWFTFWQGLVFAFVGALIGCMLDAGAASPVAAPEARTTSTSVAHLTAVLVGGVWGVASSSSWHAAAFGLPFLLLALVLWRRVALSKQWLQPPQVDSCLWVALLTYLLLACALPAHVVGSGLAP